MQEHQVQVGIETEFAAADAAVGNHRETGAGQAAVRGLDFAARQRQSGGEQSIGQRRQLPCTLQRRLPLGQRGQGNAE